MTPSIPSKQQVRLGYRQKIGALFLGFLAWFLRAWAALFASQRFPQTVLIFEPFGLGDAIALEPLIRSLPSQHGEVRVCSRSAWKALYPGTAWLDADVPWSNPHFGRKYQWRDYFSAKFRGFLKALRQLGRGSIGIDPRGDIRSVILLYLAGCRRVLTLSEYLGTDVSMLPGVAERVFPATGLRRWEINLLFLAKLGLNLSVQPRPPNFQKLLTAPKCKVDFRLGLIATAPWRGKLWPAEKWQQLIASAGQQGWSVLGLCGPKQKAETQTQLGPAVEIRECHALQSWMDELAQCSLLVSLDTGPMHLADALGVPVIALFGQGVLPLWSPSGSGSTVLAHQEADDFYQCHPVEQNAELGQKFMARITVEEVLAILRRFES